MVPKSLGEFIHQLRSRNDLHQVQVAVDPDLELSTIVGRVGADSGPALLFDRMTGYRYPLAANLFGSQARVMCALGAIDMDILAGRFASIIAPPPRVTVQEHLRNLCTSAEFAPRLSSQATCRDAKRDPDISTIPALKSWPGDGGRFLTLPLVLTCDAITGARNCGIYRMQILNDKQATVQWRSGSDAARHHAGWSEKGVPMPVAIVIGGPPVLTWAASAPLPPDVDEFGMAGLVAERPIETVRCENSDLVVPATAEFILEGYVAPGESRLEGPFGNHTGYYEPPRPAPVFHLVSITSSLQPVSTCTVVGPPPRENYWLGWASERLLLPLLQLEVPEVKDLRFLPEGIFHGAALVAVSGGGCGRELSERLWQSSLLRGSRLLVLLDDNEWQDRCKVLWRMLNHVSPDNDFWIEGNRLAVDARRKGELLHRQQVKTDPAMDLLVSHRWKEYGFD